MSHWSRSRPLAHHDHDTPTVTPLGYSAVAQRPRESVAIILQDQSLHMLQQVIDGVDDRVGQTKAQYLGLDGS